MIENSPSGPVMLGAEVAVPVTGEELRRDVVASRGGGPGREAVVQRGSRGRNAFPAREPARIAVAVVGLLLVVGSASGCDERTSPRGTAPLSTAATTTATTTTAAVATTTAEPTTTATTAEPTTTTTTTTVAPLPPPPPPQEQAVPRTTTAQVAPVPQPGCDPNYSDCVPIADDVDCRDGKGNGPAYVTGPVRVIGDDIYDLDRDGDGIACE
ncbi:hypothetical protein [Saccharothrix coeruleofusca]|uniref:Excalibur calcium-binding domain-containing protein n=1 Tax=Saccharothrix coeruleofusca TaxID=33919 RepID=A0A918EGZ0_9PSEU|nr:hypothetical protein [Saccharothrix coeruleofusca]GGP86127.1 hypothetical protein GCM10010185_69810 [Saccharothrix coeruleofusca]